jgi:hypothetical protein
MKNDKCYLTFDRSLKEFSIVTTGEAFGVRKNTFAKIVASDLREWDYAQNLVSVDGHTNTSSWDIAGLRSHSTRSKWIESKDCTTSFLELWCMYYVDTKGRTDFAFPVDRSQNTKLSHEYDIVCKQAAKVGKYFPDGSITIKLCNQTTKEGKPANYGGSKGCRGEDGHGSGSGAGSGGERGKKRKETDTQQQKGKKRKEVPGAQQQERGGEDKEKDKGKGVAFETTDSGSSSAGTIDIAKWVPPFELSKERALS